MKRLMKGDVFARILELSVVSEVPLRLTKQLEWHEFMPFGFLLVQSLRPRRILEIGTTIGDSYLAFCQAVQLCNLITECTCIPLSKESHQHNIDLQQFQEYQTYHDAHYAKFSAIENGTMSRGHIAANPNDFDLIHMISPESATELEELCSKWLPRLYPTGVALISGRGQFDQCPFKAGLSKVDPRLRVRTLQMRDWVTILSVRPLGIVGDLLLSPTDEFDSVVKLLSLLGDRVLSRHSAESVRSEVKTLTSRLAAAEESEMDAEIRAESVRSEVKTLTSRLAAAEESEMDAEIRAESVRSEVKTLTSRLAAAEESEMDAEIRFGETSLRLDREWVEKEELRRQLQKSDNGSTISTKEQPPTHLPADACLFEDVKGILLRLRQYYVGESQSSDRPGRCYWDDCGRSILASILAQQQKFVFPKRSRPTVSVIVVLRNKAHLSVLCLSSLLLETAVDYELIIVDNGSSDETIEVLSLIDSATVIRNNENLGFGPAVMQGAACASGAFLCLLNNDALLQRGSLSTLLKVFAERPEAGAAGGKIRLADGRLQEAGCIVWRDGRTHQWGREDDPRLPQYCFRRPVDYCSGVFLVTPRSLFEAVGGLDDRYAPAYYEDVDYCMKLWDAGRSVIYEPRSEIHHYEGASSLSAAGTREAIMVNHRRFTDRWRGALRAHHIEKAGNILRARIAAQSGSHKYLCFFGNLPERASGLYMDPRLQQIRSLVRDGRVVTCLYAGQNNGADSRSLFPVDTELRALSSMTSEEVSRYCGASDVIMVAAPQGANLEESKILDEHLAKVISLE